MHQFLNLDLVNDKCFLAGGSLRGLFYKEDKIDDFDLFFANGLIAAETAVKLEEHGYECVFTCPQGKLKTYKSADREIKIQLITENWYSDVPSVLNVFDIHAGRIGYDGEFIHFDLNAARSARRRELTLHVVTFPMSTFKRILKYHDKGFKVTNECIKSYVNHIHQRGINNEDIDGRFYMD